MLVFIQENRRRHVRRMVTFSPLSGTGYWWVACSPDGGVRRDDEETVRALAFEGET